MRSRDPEATLNVLLVEDDRSLAASVSEYLELDGVNCAVAGDGLAALGRCAEDGFDVILLDLNLPRLDGLEVCRRLRERGDATPVLMLTARDTVDDIVAGLGTGADDYLVKPFALAELSARVRTLSLRRTGGVREFRLDDLAVDLTNRSARRADRELDIGPTGWKLLEALVRASPAVVTREALVRAVWGYARPGTDNLKVQLHRLRRAIDTDGARPLVHTVPRRGYALRGE